MTTATPPAPVKPLSERERQELSVAKMLELLPGNLDSDRFKAFALAVLRDPNLAGCTEQSKLLALADCAKLGLYPDRNLGHVWLVPFNKSIKVGNQWRKEKQVTLIPGYQGYIELARRSGAVKSVHTGVVYQKDLDQNRFRSWTDDSGRHIHHEPAPFEEDRGKVVGVYCVATLTDGRPQIEVMSWAEVQAIKNRSKSKDDGPWVTDELQMARKTVLRRARKYWPQSPELALLGNYDDEQDGLVIEGKTVTPSKAIANLDDLTDRLIGQSEQDEPPFDGDHAEDASQTEPDAEPQHASKAHVSPSRKSKAKAEPMSEADEFERENPVDPKGSELFGNQPSATEQGQ